MWLAFEIRRTTTKMGLNQKCSRARARARALAGKAMMTLFIYCPNKCSRHQRARQGELLPWQAGNSSDKADKAEITLHLISAKCCVTLRCVASRHATLRHDTWRYVTTRLVTTRHVTRRHVTTRHVTSRSIVKIYSSSPTLTCALYMSAFVSFEMKIRLKYICIGLPFQKGCG